MTGAPRTRTRVAVIQGILPPYRVPVFAGLGRDFDVTVIHSGPRSNAGGSGFEERVVPVRRLGPLQVQMGLRPAAGDADVVIAMFDLRWLASARLLLASRRPGFVWWGHGFGASPALRALRAWLARRADAMLLYDAESVDAFVARGIPENRIFVAPNTIHVARPRPGAEAAARRSFVFVGRLQPRKRLDLLLDAFAAALPRLPEHVRVEIVGVGPEGAKLRRRAAAAGLGDRVVFHGEVRDETVLAGIFARALAYVSPGHVGLGVLHSFAFGVPVVTRRGAGHAPEISNVRHGRTGLLVEGSAGSFAEALAELAVHPDRAARLGDRAHRHYVEERTLEHMLAGFRGAVARARGRGARS